MTTSEREPTSYVEMFHGAEDKPFDRWTTFTIRDAFDDPLGSFDFETRPGENEFERYYETLQKGDMVLIKVNGHIQQLGLIQTKTTTFSRDGGGVIRLQGNWPISILYDSCVDPNFTIDTITDTRAVGLVQRIANEYGLFVTAEDRWDSTVNVMTGKALGGDVQDLVKVEELKVGQANPHQNEKAYTYLARLITRLGAVLRQQYDGYLILSRPHYKQPVAYNVALPPSGNDADTDLFMDNLTITDSNNEQYGTIIVRGESSDKKGQKRTSEPEVAMCVEGKVVMQPVVDKAYEKAAPGVPPPQVEVLDDEFNTFIGNPHHQLYQAGNVQLTYYYGEIPGVFAPFRFKPLYIKDKSARDVQQAKNLAMLMFGLRAPRAFNITGTVPGFVSASGRVWTIDTICNVQIPQIGLNEDMWVLERTLKLDRNGGQTTDLKLLPKGWFMIGEAPSG